MIYIGNAVHIHRYYYDTNSSFKNRMSNFFLAWSVTSCGVGGHIMRENLVSPGEKVVNNDNVHEHER